MILVIVLLWLLVCYINGCVLSYLVDTLIWNNINKEVKNDVFASTRYCVYNPYWAILSVFTGYEALGME